MPPQPQNALEDLVVENRRTYSPELTAARSQPRDEQATNDLKADSDRMERLAELAEVEPERVVDAAVRGRNVTFVVADGLDDNGAPTGAISTGFFALSDLDGSGKRKRAGGTSSRPKVPRSPRGGTATVPSVKDEERGEAETDPAGPEQPGTGPDPGASGVPDNLSELNARDTAKLITSPPEGVDPAAVLAAEQARDEPRKSVLAAAEKSGVG